MEEKDTCAIEALQKEQAFAERKVLNLEQRMAAVTSTRSRIRFEKDIEFLRGRISGIKIALGYLE